MGDFMVREKNKYSLDSIFGDSKVIIDWARGLTILQSLSYDCWLKRIGLLKNFFLSLSFRHLYREFNSDADNLSNIVIGDYPSILHLYKYSINRIMITEGCFTCFQFLHSGFALDYFRLYLHDNSSEPWYFLSHSYFCLFHIFAFYRLMGRIPLVYFWIL